MIVAEGGSIDVVNGAMFFNTKAFAMVCQLEQSPVAWPSERIETNPCHKQESDPRTGSEPRLKDPKRPIAECFQTGHV